MQKCIDSLRNLQEQQTKITHIVKIEPDQCIQKSTQLINTTNKARARN